METFRSWLYFTLWALGGAFVIVLGFDFLTSSYETLQEPWFFIFVIVMYSMVVALMASMHGARLESRRDGF